MYVHLHVCSAHSNFLSVFIVMVLRNCCTVLWVFFVHVYLYVFVHCRLMYVLKHSCRKKNVCMSCDCFLHPNKGQVKLVLVHVLLLSMKHSSIIFVNVTLNSNEPLDVLYYVYSIHVTIFVFCRVLARKRQHMAIKKVRLVLISTLLKYLCPFSCPIKGWSLVWVVWPVSGLRLVLRNGRKQNWLQS